MVSISGTTSLESERVGGPLEYRRHGRDGEIGQIVPHFERESDALQRRGELVGRDEVAAVGYVGPRHREDQSLLGACRGVPERETATGAQNAAGFAVQPRFIGDVHLNVLTDNDIDAAIRQRQVSHISFDHLDPIVEVYKAVQPPGSVAVFSGEIDCCHPTAVLGSQ